MSRTYADHCGIARALDVVGERWALLVVRELIFGPKRFTDLRAGLPGIGPDVLAQRLRELQAAGLITKRRLPPPAASSVYELTPRGAELEPVLLAIGRWGTGQPLPTDPDATFSPDAMMLALKTVFTPGAADAAIDLTLTDYRYRVAVADGVLQISANPDGPVAPASLATDTGTLAETLWRGQPLRDAEAVGAATVLGDRRVLDRLLRAFARPMARVDIHSRTE